MYNVTASEVIPAFQVVIFNNDLQSVYSTNDETVYSMSFKLTNSTEQESQIVQAISCDKYIAQYLSELEPEQIESINSELLGNADQYLCPDSAFFTLEGVMSGTELSFQVQLSPALQQQYIDNSEEWLTTNQRLVQQTQVRGLYITQYFNADFYS